jgi:hypothetical protein
MFGFQTCIIHTEEEDGGLLKGEIWLITSVQRRKLFLPSKEQNFTVGEEDL